MKRTGSRSGPRSASTVQRASCDDHAARFTRCPKRMRLSMPYRRRGVLQVLEDRRPVGDRLRLRPRPERVAERVHVGVGADAGIAEQVPRAADVGAAFEDRVGPARAALLQVTAGADAGNAGADDQDVEVLSADMQLRYHWQLDRARRARRAPDALRRLHVTLRLREHDVRHERLRVAVVEREPARLDLHHDAMARQERVARVRQRGSGTAAPCSAPAAAASRSRRGSGRGRCRPTASADSRRASGAPALRRATRR